MDSDNHASQEKELRDRAERLEAEVSGLYRAIEEALKRLEWMLEARDLPDAEKRGVIHLIHDSLEKARREADGSEMPF